MYGSLPNTGMNISTPVYALVGIVMIVVGGITAILSKINNR